MSNEQLSRAMSKILRHDALKIGLKISGDGYVLVDDLLKTRDMKRFDRQRLFDAVAENNKQRFSVKEEEGRWYVRANQGHTIPLNDDELLTPVLDAGEVEICVHGTYEAALPSILSRGLSRMGRNHIHFSIAHKGSKVAISGMRSSCEIEIHLNVPLLLASGIKLYRSDNNVLLSPGNELGIISPAFFTRVVRLRTGEDVPIPPTCDASPAAMDAGAAGGVGGAVGGGGAAGGGGGEDAGGEERDPMKKLRNQISSVTKKLQDIAQLKLDQASGKTLEKNQLKKLGNEEEFKQRLESLEREFIALDSAQPDMQATAQPLAAAAPREPCAQPFDVYAVLDFEATCDDKTKIKPQEIIEFPCVLVDARTLEKFDEIQLYLRPRANPRLTAFCTELTGIQQEWVDAGVDIQEAITLMDAFLQKNGLAGPEATRSFAWVTCGDWDLNQMLPGQKKAQNLQVPSYYNQWVNIKKPYTAMYSTNTTGMAGMLRFLNIPLVGRHHSGLDDCRNIASILIRLIQDGCVVDITTKKVYK